MDTLTKLFSSPVWNGIQGVLTALTFLFLLHEKRKQLAPYLKKTILVLNETLRLLVPIFFGWLFSFMIFFLPFESLATFAFGNFRLDSFIHDLPSSALNHLKYIMPSSLAALSSFEKELSQKRSVFIGRIVAAVSYFYLYFFQMRPDIVQIFVQIFPDYTDPKSKIIELIFISIILLFSTLLGSWITGTFTGILSTNGVYYGRVFIDRAKVHFGEGFRKKIISIITGLKNYLPK